jgi:hypothetical protein
MKRVMEISLSVGVSIGLSAVMVYANQCINSPFSAGTVVIQPCVDTNQIVHPPNLSFGDPNYPGSILFDHVGVVTFGDLPGMGTVSGTARLLFGCNGGTTYDYIMTTSSTGAVVSRGDSGTMVVGGYDTDSLLRPGDRPFTGVYCGATSSSDTTRAWMRAAVPGEGEGEGEQPIAATEILDKAGIVRGSVRVFGDSQDADAPATLQMDNTSGAGITVTPDGRVIIQLGS